MARRRKRTARARRFPDLVVDFEEQRTLLAEEQTLLAKERTILSFMQTGLAFIGAGIVVANVIQDIYFKGLGWILIIIGFLELFESYRRLHLYQKKMDSLKQSLRGRGV